ncbi:RHS repeat-associated core domain-containing protein [Thalassobellus citreus]|uniref:RHS repeat domain-containing protein n=1 Tax=Thalassobellus citreus TaxID=3367752 RepID=UPI00378D4C18
MKNIIIKTLLVFLLSTTLIWSQENAPNPSDTINWISSVNYNLNGNTVSKSVGYFNTLGKATQSQSWDVLSDSIWTSQTMYDYQGRPALQTLSAPIGKTFGYKLDFFRNSSNNPYTTANFDSSLESPSTVGGTNQSNTLGWYYSNYNSHEKYQDVTSYPFSRSIYSKLNPGTVLKTIGGNKVKVNGTDKWVQGYSFNMPVAQELHYAFGSSHFPSQKVTEDVCVSPPSIAPHYYYMYDLAPVNIDDCSLNTASALIKVKLDIQQNIEYQINKIYKINVMGSGLGYYKIINKTQVTNPNIFTFLGFVSCGPYNTCTDIYIKADFIKATKTIMRDVNGIESVVFADSDGNTLAAARSGNEDNPNRKKYSVLSPIGAQGFVDIHIPVGCNGNINFVAPSGTTFNIFDLVTETKLNGDTPITASFYYLKAGIYRIEQVTSSADNKLPYTKINNGTIDLVQPATNVAVRYNVNYYDYSLNFYDKTGRLTQSVQPEGFDATLNLTTPTRNHALTSTFAYNTLGQLQNASSPDEGKAWFLYRKDGQIRFSINTKQWENQEFSYTNYDDLGRPIASGVYIDDIYGDYIEPYSTTITNPFKSALKNVVDTTGPTDNYPDNPQEQNTTRYDEATGSLVNYVHSDYTNPTFLAGNVAMTDNGDNTTWYSYDVYGRVKWLVQEISGLGYKTIDYEYDYVTGSVSKVIYQKHNSSDMFVHKYNYNKANQLTSVETSTDNVNFTEQESYKYYETGALKRKELLGGIQGTDYVYNLSGQLKAINHPSLSPTKDPGHDNNDAFGMLIDYNQNDYARTQRSNITSTTFGTDQFNGNIKATRWNTYSNALPNAKENTYTYQYNKNNWLESATYGEHTITGNTTNTNLQANVNTTSVITNGNTLNLEATNSITLQPGFHAQSGSNSTAKIYTLAGFSQKNNGDYSVKGITYDSNGNIKSLKRNKNTENGSNAMDDLSYEYYDDPIDADNDFKPNQLKRVNDAAGKVAGADDIGDQNGNNYKYNSIGQLIEDHENATVEDPTNIIRYIYNARGLVTEVSKKNVPLVKFFYNDRGHRVKKQVYKEGGSLTKTEYYVRDAAGSVMAIYNGNAIQEQPIYGASRIGVYKRVDDSSLYQLTDHLGNVRAVIGKDSNNNMLMLSYTDYYPFGMPMPNRDMGPNQYRYKYQGQEKDTETGKEAFQLRLWDARIGRWLTTDPYRQYHSPYLGMGNNPISQIDPDGGKADDWKKDKNGNYVYDSNLTAENAKDFLGKGETYVGKSYYKPGEFYLMEGGHIFNFKTNEVSKAFDAGLPEVVIGSSSTLANPTENGVIRTQDGHGSGEFHASRDGGSRLHAGIDITTIVGQDITAPIDGVVRNFVGRTSGIPMLQIFPSDTTLGIERIDILYVNRLNNIRPWVNYNITRGETVLGTAADLSGLGYPATITPHVHVQIHSGAEFINPTNFFNFD